MPLDARDQEVLDKTFVRALVGRLDDLRLHIKTCDIHLSFCAEQSS
jgi:hypothetical protein